METQAVVARLRMRDAQHFKVAALLFVGNGGGLLAFTAFRDYLAPPHGVMLVVSGIGLAAAIVFLVSVLIVRRIAKDPPNPAARALILLSMGAVLVGLAALIVASAICFVWFAMDW